MEGFLGSQESTHTSDWISQSAETLVLKLTSVALERGNREGQVGSFW